MVKINFLILLLCFPFCVKGQSLMTTQNQEIMSKTITEISRQKEKENSVVRIHFTDNEDDNMIAYVFKDTNFYLYENYFYITQIGNKEVVITSDIMAFLPSDKFDYFYIFKRYFPTQYDKFLSDYRFLGENNVIFKAKINNNHKGIALHFRENQFLKKEKLSFEIKQNENPFENFKNGAFIKEFNRISRNFDGITEVSISKTSKGFVYKIHKIDHSFSNRNDFFIEKKFDSIPYILSDKAFEYISVNEKEKLNICKRYFNKEYQYFLQTGEFLYFLPPNDEKKAFSILYFNDNILEKIVDENQEINEKTIKFLKEYQEFREYE